jgi:hypothetical protein
MDLRQLLHLVAADVKTPEDHLHNVFSWRFSRGMSVIQIALGFSVTLLAATIAVAFGQDSDVASWTYALLFGGVSLGLVVGGVTLFRQRTLGAEYLAALALYKRLQPMAPFLRRYLES